MLKLLVLYTIKKYFGIIFIFVYYEKNNFIYTLYIVLSNINIKRKSHETIILSKYNEISGWSKSENPEMKI